MNSIVIMSAGATGTLVTLSVYSAICLGQIGSAILFLVVAIYPAFVAFNRLTGGSDDELV